MNITKLLNKVYFAPRLKEIELYTEHAGELQAGVLKRLVRMAANTEWGKKYDYASIRTYEDFKKTPSHTDLRRNQTLCSPLACR